jgi:TusA-related sulfurtransferase
MRLHKAIVPLERGAVVHITSDDEAVFIDLREYAARGGHEWLGSRRGPPGTFEAEVRRGA